MKRIALATLATLLSACGGTPECGDDEVIDLVRDIAAKDFWDAWEPYVDAANAGTSGLEPFKGKTLADVKPLMGLDLVTTTEHDDDTDAYACGANLLVTSVDGEKVTPHQIQYTVRSSATDSGQFVVEVFGL